MNTTPGIDEAWQQLTPAQMLAAGKAFVVGYLGEDTTGKNLTRAEVDAYHRAGIAVLLVYEYSTHAAESGSTGGAANATLAVRQARALGYPAGCAIAFAIDEGSPDQNALGFYAAAFTSVCHSNGYRSMVYGGKATVTQCLDRGLVDLAWQTYAWSGTPTVWDSRAAIRQVQNGVTIAGSNVDLDIAMIDDYGAWAPEGDTMFDQNAANQLTAVWDGMFFGGPDCGKPVPGTPINVDPSNPNPGSSVFDKLDHIIVKLDQPGPVQLTDAQLAQVLAALPTAKQIAVELITALGGHPAGA